MFNKIKGEKFALHSIIYLTIVEVTQVSGIEEEMCPEKVSEAASPWPEWKRGVQMKPPSPIRLPTEVIACHQSEKTNISHEYIEILSFVRVRVIYLHSEGRCCTC